MHVNVCYMLMHMHTYSVRPEYFIVETVSINMLTPIFVIVPKNDRICEIF